MIAALRDYCPFCDRTDTHIHTPYGLVDSKKSLARVIRSCFRNLDFGWLDALLDYRDITYPG